jgi:ankyrin repeat protein
MDFRNQLNIMRLLLDNGADVNAQDNYGATPLHHSSLWWKNGYAPARGTVEGSRLLIERGAKIDARNKKGKTPLQLAVQGRHHKMVEFLSGFEAE